AVYGSYAAVRARGVGLEQVFRVGAALRDDLAKSIQVEGLILSAGVPRRAGTQAGAGDVQDFLGKGQEWPSTEGRREPPARHLDAQAFALLVRPVLDEFRAGIERRLVVEQPDPERRQRADPAPRA